MNLQASWQRAVDQAFELNKWALLNALMVFGPRSDVDYETVIRMMEDKCQSTTT